jgi:DNA integrity scanning protein DisA with diadenylate cyclase activity
MASAATIRQIGSVATWCRPEVIEATLELAVEIARDGREGHHVGTLFTVGAADAVLARSRPLILDPLAGHMPAETHITDPRLRGTIKQLAQLDGAFVIDDNGIVRGACQYLDVSAEGVDLPMGLGSRHLTAASISKALRVLAIAVSESSRIRVFCHGDLLLDIGAD